MYNLLSIRKEVGELQEELELMQCEDLTQEQFDKIAADVVSILLGLVDLDNESPDDNFIAFVEAYQFG